jgi:two-component system response regulator YesN
MKITHDYAISPEDIFGKDMDFLNALSSLHTPAAMKSWLTEHCLTLSACIKRERVDSSKLLAQNAQQFIQEHYSNPSISVETLCSFLHVSPAYFSTVFKRETEQSFVSYLTDVRLQNALNLLDTTNDKTYMIAEKVGYTESNYFSYVFKKRFGVSPSKYRSNQEHPLNNRSAES